MLRRDSLPCGGTRRVSRRGTPRIRRCGTRLTAPQDRLRLKIIDDNLFDNERFSTSGELTDFIRRHLSDPLLYAADGDQPSDMLWIRVPVPHVS